MVNARLQEGVHVHGIVVLTRSHGEGLDPEIVVKVRYDNNVASRRRGRPMMEQGAQSPRVVEDDLQRLGGIVLGTKLEMCAW